MIDNPADTDDTPDARYARAELAARWFLRSGMRPPTPETQRALVDALAAAELADGSWSFDI